jgi:hypothetical protein
MSRRIVQIAATASGPETVETLYALDNNGIAWIMTRPFAGAAWNRLPPLPSLENRTPLGVPASPTLDLERDT